MRLSTVALGATTAILAFLVGIAAALGDRGMLINTTPSYPRGLYAPLARRAAVGDLVAFCPSREVANYALARGYVSPGRCPSGSVPLIKRLAAAGGNLVAIGPDGVQIDGRTLDNSKPLTRDGAGRPLPRFRLARVLFAREVLLMSDYAAGSFDSRYFGPVDRGGVQRPLRPVLTWP